MLKRFLAYYKPVMGLFIADTVCAVVVAGVDLAFPVILRSLTGGLFTEGTAAILSALPALAAGLIAMYLVRCGCRYFVSAQGHIMGARMESQMRQDLFDQYERMGFSYFDSHSSGDMMSRVVNDLFDICEAAHHVPEWIIICAIEIIGSFVILFGLSPALASAILVVTLVFAAVMLRMNLTMRATFTDNRKKIGGVNAQLQDSLEGIRVVKSFANEGYLDSKEDMYKTMGRYYGVYGLMTGALYTVVAVMGGWLVARGELSAVDMATFALYISLFCTPIETLVNSTEMYQKAIAGFRRMDEVLRTVPDVDDAPGAPDFVPGPGAIEYRDVCFTYSDVELDEDGEARERPVIDHLSLTVRPGETLALVGPSGGGKSTTCSLLPRFYDVASGSITIDGQDVREVTQASLRRAIGLVQQDVYLFDGTIGENIAYGKPDATREEIEAAAKAAHAHGFISRLPQGYDTVIGEDGGALSQGQKQLLCIARCMLCLPPMLILDEATSSIDTRTELKIQDAFETMMKGRTSFIVAHRLSTIQSADVILVMRDGHIVEQGSHDELLRKGGFYARLYRSQFDGVQI